MNKFYMTLPSNVNREYFENTVTNFKTKLATHVELHGEWEAGLSTISYTNSWLNLPEKEIIRFKYFCKGIHVLEQEAKVKKGLYLDINTLLIAINSAIKKSENEANMTNNKIKRYAREVYGDNWGKEAKSAKQYYGRKDKTTIYSKLKKNEFGQVPYDWDIWEPNEPIPTDKVDIERDSPKLKEIKLPRFKIDDERKKLISCELTKYEDSLVFIQMSHQLCRMLGYDIESMDINTSEKLNTYQKTYDKIVSQSKKKRFTPKLLVKRNDEILWGRSPYELFSSFHSLFVYCDIIKPSYVGDSFTQLLRFVEIPPNAQFGEQIVLTYPDTHYFPLNTREFNSIEIDIRDDTGRRIPFLFGRTLVILHFRRKNIKS